MEITLTLITVLLFNFSTCSGGADIFIREIWNYSKAGSISGFENLPRICYFMTAGSKGEIYAF